MAMQAVYIGTNSDFADIVKKKCQEIKISFVFSSQFIPEENHSTYDLVFVDADLFLESDPIPSYRLAVAVTDQGNRSVPTDKLASLEHYIFCDQDSQALDNNLEYLLARATYLHQCGTDDSPQLLDLQSQLQQAYKHVSLHEQILQKMVQISALSRQINCLDLDRIASVCIESIPKLISARFASLYSYDHKTQVLHLLRHNHPYTINRLVIAAEHPRSPMVTAVHNKQLQLIKNLAQWTNEDNRHVKRQFNRNYRSNSCIIAPLLSGDDVVGVLNLADKIDADGFDQHQDLPPIQLLCEIIGSAMTNIELYDKVMRQARTDGVTGLLNHRTFYSELDREVSRQKRYGGNLSLIMVDLDGLKKINDTFGHRAGDLSIRHVATQIRRCIRESDIAARYGGDEFAVILPNTQLADATVVAGRLVQLVSDKPIFFDNHELAISVSVGLGQLRPDTSLEDLMNRADTALFEAKSSGKNQLQIFSETAV